ncbi:hypothetical protein BaRGS_00018949 [Batillaria attramentaria]|uniref:Fucosyltransferase n=1 Tax=Batillaria attramentaria TaxID=370345 RepID=A0ABD0KR71_9CAEN
MKKMVRARIAEKTSSIGVAFRTGDEARLKWKGLKKKVTEKDNDCSATGGGRPKTRIIPFEDLVMAVIGEKSSLHNGIDGGLQTVDCGGYKVTQFPVTSVSGKGSGTGTRGAKTMLLSVPHEMQQGPAIIELPEQVYTSQDLPVQPSTSSSNMAVVPESQPPSTNPVVTPVRSRGWKARLMKRRREASGSKQSRGETAIEDKEESCVFKEVGDRGHQPVSLHEVAQDETAKWLVVAPTLLEKFTFPQDLGIVDTPWPFGNAVPKNEISIKDHLIKKMFDSDIVDLYGYMAMRETVPVKNYTNILAKKTKFAAWLVSNCWTPGKRMDYIKRLQKLVPVDIYGGCGPHKCPRSHDNACFEKFSTQYKFYLSFESGLCQDYVSEKFFRYMETDAVVVARGDGHKYLAPRGTFVNTADFAGIRELADHLKYLDANTEEYINILKAKDEYVPLYEDYPIRDPQGNVKYMAYHYEAVSFCETCRRLWDLDNHRKTIADLPAWFDNGNCYPPEDITDV